MFMVFSYHAWEFGDSPDFGAHVFGRHLGFGAVFAGFPAGVDLFMVLSGFCLFWPVCIKPASVADWSWQDYARRRIHRIVPPYYAAIVYCTLLPIVLVFVYRLLHQPAKWQHLPSVWQYVTHLLFLHTLFADTWGGIQGAFWSLGLEAQFYVAFPLVILAYRKYGIKVAAGMTLISVIYRVIVGVLTAHSPWIMQFLPSVFFLGRWMQFAAGMTAAWIVARTIRTDTPYSARIGSVMLAAGLAVYAVALANMPKSLTFLPVRDLLLAAAFAGTLVALCGSLTPLKKPFESEGLVWLGTISYSIFLIHQNTIFYVSELLKKVLHLAGPARFLALDTFGFAFIVGIAFLFFKLFEAPFMSRVPKSPWKFARSGKESRIAL